MKTYEELYHIAENEKTSVSVVEDAVSGQKYIRKIMSVYEISVFDYLINNQNEHIPQIYEYKEADGKLTVIEELVRGETLEVLLERGKISSSEKRKVLEDVCDGVIFLHCRKPPIIYRDIKPANILVDTDMNVKIVDFDAARVYKPGETKDTILLGTQEYAAPEQYGFSQSDVRTDVYGIGMLIKAMFPKDYRLLKIAAAATEMSPKDRYSSVKELKDKIIHRKMLGGLGPEGRDADVCFCMNCGAILYDQEGFGNNDGTWTCRICGQSLFGDEAGDTGGKTNGVVWYCDHCKAILNKQPGFDYYDDTWVCTECGFENDISENNIDPVPRRK